MAPHKCVSLIEKQSFHRINSLLWAALLIKWLVCWWCVTLTKNLKPPRDSSVCTTLNLLTLTFLSPWQLLSKIYCDGPVIDFKLYLEISFMSHANDEKWDLKRPIWPWSWTRMTGCRRTHRCLALQLWPVLDCSVQQSMKGTLPLLLYIDVALKVWNGTWQQKKRMKGPPAKIRYFS